MPIPSPPQCPPSQIFLGIALALTGPHGGQTGGQRALPPLLQSAFLWWCLPPPALPHAMHGPEQMGYNTWSLNYLTVPILGLGNTTEMAACGASPENVLGVLGAAATVNPKAASSSQQLTIPSPNSPGLQGHRLPFLPPSLTLSSCPR